MKSICCYALALTLSTTSVRATEPFTIIAPSRAKERLLIVQATPTSTELTLKLSEQIPLKFPAATIVSHPDKPILYVSAARGEEGRTPGAVVYLENNSSYQRREAVTFRHGYSYLSLDRSHQFLLGANYFDGHVDVYRLTKTGAIGERVAALNEGRRNAHCVLPSPDNRFVYIPYVKETNAIFQYRFNPENGSLTPLQPKDAGPPEGTGPRHMAYHPKKPFAYFSNEQHLGVSVYAIEESGKLTLQQVCDAVADKEPKEGVSSSDIVITRDGRFLFAGIRGHQRDFDWISRYRVKSNGEIIHLGLTAADKIPWGLALSPDGGHLLVTAFEGASLTAYRISTEGELDQVARLPWDEKISDLITR